MDARKQRPSLLDVARHAGVSSATVSRVLNNTAPVRQEVRDRVLASVSVLGYHASSGSAPSVMENALALLVPDILNPYFTEIARVIQREASVDGYLPFVLDTAEDPRREYDVMRMLIGQPIRGIVMCGSRIPLSDLTAIRSHLTVPMVMINRNVRLPQVSCILFEMEGATFRAARHLLELNHIRIAYLPGPSLSETSQLRRRGIEAALREAGLALRPELCPVSFPDVDGGFQATSALLALPPAQRPTAIIAYNDLMALGVLHALRAHHLRVPEDVSVVGVDNISMAEHANPPLTTIAQPRDRIGHLAMQIMRHMIKGEPLLEEGYTLLECPLTIRASTAPAPASANGALADSITRSHSIEG